MASRRISVVERKPLKFVITDRPQADVIETYLQDLQANNVSSLVRVCEPSYDTELLIKSGIGVQDWSYPDGDNPTAEIINSWLTLCFATFYNEENAGSSIAVHCVAGLGRAPVMVALALIESGMSPEDAVLFIRERRKGAINSKQLEFLQSYKPRKAFSTKRNGSNRGKGKWWPF